MTDNPRTMTKGEFATFVGRSAGRVSQWIAAGQIGAEALAGEGRAARIVVDVALVHLAARLDPAQRMGINAILAGGAIPRVAQDQSARLPDGAALFPAPDGDAPQGAAPPRHADRAPGAPSGAGFGFGNDATAEAIAREKLEQARMQTARMRRDERAADGTYMLASDARAAIAKSATLVLQSIEGGLADAANAIAARFDSAPSRDVQYILTGWLRGVRENAARTFGELASAESVLVDDGDLEDDGD